MVPVTGLEPAQKSAKPVGALSILLFCVQIRVQFLVKVIVYQLIRVFLVFLEEMLIDVFHGIVCTPPAPCHCHLVHDADRQHDRGVGVPKPVNAWEGDSVLVADHSLSSSGL